MNPLIDNTFHILLGPDSALADSEAVGGDLSRQLLCRA